MLTRTTVKSSDQTQTEESHGDVMVKLMVNVLQVSIISAK